MFLLAHAGITLGAAVLGSGAVGTVKDRRKAQPPRGLVAWVLSLSRWLDIRLLLIGALLPDIIDKPLGNLLLRGTLNNGRIFAHTLLFAIMLFLPGLWLYLSRRRTWLLALGIGVVAHLVLDEMWLDPRALFWPVYGWQWPSYTEVDTFSVWLNKLVHSPAVYVPEIIGTIILAGFAALVIYRKKTVRFVKQGKLEV